MRNLISSFIVATGIQASAWAVVVPLQPVSPYADTEVSTNVPINKADISYADLKFRFSGTPTNALELSFGTDANTNGVLEANEVETSFGWRAGRYFVESVRSWERYVSEATSPYSNLSIDIHLDVRYDSQQVRKVAITGDNVSAFNSLVAERPPAWIWRREWNLMRVTRRGSETPSDWIYYKAANHGFTVRLR